MLIITLTVMIAATTAITVTVRQCFRLGNIRDVAGRVPPPLIRRTTWLHI